MKYTLQYERTRENYNEATNEVVKDETLNNKNGSENQYFWNSIQKRPEKKRFY